MKTPALVLLMLAAACAGPRYAERTGPVPPAPPAPVTTAPPVIAPVNEEATRAWLDREIELAPRVEPPEPIVQVVERTVERPVYVNDDRRYRYPHYDPYYRPRYRHSTFPINTALGAGIGAIIGHQDGHRGRGAWIGGSIGYLFDAARW